MGRHVCPARVGVDGQDNGLDERDFTQASKESLVGKRRKTKADN